jgi:hypothetical protein
MTDRGPFLHVQIDPELLAETKACAERADTPLSRYVRAALRAANVRRQTKRNKSVDSRRVRA